MAEKRTAPANAPVKTIAKVASAKTPAKAVAKAAPAKAAAAKVPARGAPAKAAPAKKHEKGTPLACETCGMVVIVDELCDCVEVHELICCGEPMKPRTEKAVKVKVK